MSTYGSLQGSFSSFSDDEKLNYSLKIALSRLQTDLGADWFNEPTDFIPKQPLELYKNVIPGYKSIQNFLLIDPDVDGNGTEMVTDKTVGDILSVASNGSQFTLDDILNTAKVRDPSQFASLSDSNFVDGSSRTQIKLLGRNMFTRYKYWLGGLTGKNSLLKGGAKDGTGGESTGTTPDTEEPFNAYITYTDAGDLSPERRWSVINGASETSDHKEFYNKLISEGVELNIIDPNLKSDLTKKHPFLKLCLQVLTYTTRGTAPISQSDNSSSGGSVNKTDNIGFHNPLMEKALGDTNGFLSGAGYQIAGWNGSSWKSVTTSYGTPGYQNILYFVSNPGFILIYGQKNIDYGYFTSRSHPPMITFMKYTGETFSDGIISQGNTLPAVEVSNPKDLFINTAENTIHRLADNNGTKEWIGIGGSGGGGGGGGSVGALNIVQNNVGIHSFTFSGSDFTNATTSSRNSKPVITITSGELPNCEFVLKTGGSISKETNAIKCTGYCELLFNPHIKINNQQQQFTVSVTIERTIQEDTRNFYVGVNGRAESGDYWGSYEKNSTDSFKSYNYNLAHGGGKVLVSQSGTGETVYEGSVVNENTVDGSEGIDRFDPYSEYIFLIFLLNHSASNSNECKIKKIEITSNQSMIQNYRYDNTDDIEQTSPLLTKTILEANDVDDSLKIDGKITAIRVGNGSNIIPDHGFNGSTTAVFGYGNPTNQYGIAMGTLRSSGTSWIQAKRLKHTNDAGNSLKFNLAINPRGGRVGFGHDDALTGIVNIIDLTNRHHTVGFSDKMPALRIYQGNKAGRSYVFTNSTVSIAQRTEEKLNINESTETSVPTNTYGMVLGIGGHPNIGLRTHTGNGYPSGSIELVHGYWNNSDLANQPEASRLPYKKVIINTNGDSYFNGGNVGIGTSSPTHKLHIEGTPLSSSSDYSSEEILKLSRNGWTTVGPKGSIFSIALSYYEYPSNNYPRTRVDFKTSGKTTDAYTTPTTIMSLRDDGNVGIGTTSPAEKLHVHDGNIQIGTNGDSSSHYLRLRRASINALISMYNMHLFINCAQGISLTTNDQSDNPEFKIISGGNVGIGTTTPSGIFSVTNKRIYHFAINSSDLANCTSETINSKTCITLNSGLTNSEFVLVNGSSMTSVSTGIKFVGYCKVKFNPHIKINDANQTFKITVVIERTVHSDTARKFYIGGNGRGSSDEYAGTYVKNSTDTFTDYNYNMANGDVYTTTDTTTYTQVVGGFNTVGGSESINRFDSGSEYLYILFLLNHSVSNTNECVIKSIEITSNQLMIQNYRETSSDYFEEKLRKPSLNIDKYSGNIGIGVETSDILSKLDIKDQALLSEDPIVSIFRGPEGSFSNSEQRNHTNTLVSVVQRDTSINYGLVLGPGAHPTVGLKTQNNSNFPQGVLELAYGYTGSPTANPPTQDGPRNDMQYNISKKVVIDSNGDSYFNGGNVGIGISSPQEKLTVNGNVCIFHDQAEENAGAGLIFHSDTYERAFYMSPETYGAGAAPSSNAKLRIGYHATSGLLSSDSITTADFTSNNIMVIRGDGNVGIGTDNPQANLHISSGTSGDCNLILESDTDNAGTENDNPHIFFRQDGGLYESAIYMDSNQLVLSNSVSTYSGIIFKTDTDDDGWENAPERMRITETGNVGIGTDSPTHKLHIQGESGTTGPHQYPLRIDSKYYDNDKYLEIGNNNSYALYNTTAPSGHFFSQTVSLNNGKISAYNVSDLKLCTSQGNDVRMTITDISGHVGIGTESPDYPLQVDIQETDNSISALRLTGAADGDDVTLATITSADVSIKASKSIWSGDKFIVNSDERIKTNITEVPDNLSLQKLRDISCCYYEYKDKITKGTDKTIGFIAQQVKEHMSMAVSLKNNIIPNELRLLSDYKWSEITELSNNKYKLTINDLDVSDNSENTLYRFYVSNDISGNDECKKEIRSLIDEPKSFIFDQSWNNIYVYGKEVNDFHTLDKQKLFALILSATQEIDRIQQEEQNKLTQANQKISELELEVSNLKNQLSSVNTELSTIKQHLGL